MAKNRELVSFYGMDEIRNAPPRLSGKALVGRNLRWVREVVADRMSDCAKMMDVHICTWSLWEKGHRWPDPEVMARFCEVTGVTMDFLYRGDTRGVAEDVAFHLLAAHRELLVAAPASVLRARAAAREQSLEAV
jgi:transcriptional regulator with XRE-family HTH domain